MIVKSLKLKNFRNHSYLYYEFKPGLNIITGNNGVGKTNIVEAIYYLSLARSFRTQEDKDLIKEGKVNAEIDSVVLEGEISRKIRVLFSEQGRQVLLNNKPISKLSELVKCVNVTLFEPKDVLLFRGSPKARRNFLDINISKKMPAYLEYTSKYERVLKQRNDILKADNVDQLLLDTSTDMLVELSKPIVQTRTAYVKDINDILIKITRALTGEDEPVEIHYEPYVPLDDNFINSAKEAFKRSLEGDLKRKATSIGVHREDLSVTLKGKDIGEFGSQGENRIVALALKLSPYFLIQDKDKRPVVVLDDVMSELDQAHRLRLIKLLNKFEQVFITATKLEVKNAAHYTLKTK